MTSEMSFAAAPLILVTGATGWLGRRVVSMLVNGSRDYPPIYSSVARVRCLVQAGERTDELRQHGVEIAVGDIRDIDACQRFVQDAEGALVLHLAGVIHPPGRTWWFNAVNFHGTMNFYRTAKAAGISRFVAMSSNSPFGANVRTTDLFTEDSSYHPYMGYGKSKHAMEVALRQAMQLPAGPEIVIIRAPWFYGPDQPHRQSLFFTLIKNGRFPIIGTGENRRSMAYTDNLAYGLLLSAAQPKAAGNIFWIADERPYSMNEILATVGDVLRADFGMSVSSRIPHLPSFVSDAARAADSLLQAAGIYNQKIHVLSEMNLTIACSIEKAKKVLGFTPKIALREGMRRSVEWCLGQNIAL